MKINYTDIIGKKVDRLTVVSFNRYDNQNHRYYYNCICSCGNTCVVERHRLIYGTTRSCGCLAKECAIRLGKSRRKEKQNCSFCKQNVVYAKGLCRNCYARYLRNGTPQYYVSKNAKRKARKAERIERFKTLSPLSDVGKEMLQKIINGAKIKDIAKEYGVSRQCIYNKLYNKR